MKKVLSLLAIVGLKLGHRLPVIENIDINGEPTRGSANAV